MNNAPLALSGQHLSWLAPIDKLANFTKPSESWSETDAAWVYRYLCNGCGSPATRKAVQGEMLRLAYFMRKNSIPDLSALSSDDAAGYRDWLANRKETTEVSAKPVSRLINDTFNPSWRPFRSTEPLSSNAIKTALRLISGCLAFMQDDPQCPVQGNPFRRIAKAVEHTKRDVADVDDDQHLYTKALSRHALAALFAYVESDQFRGGERSRIAKHWLLLLLSKTAVRVDTLVKLTTDNLFPDPSEPGQYRLRFRAKHNSRVDQPWLDELESAHQAYVAAYNIAEPEKRMPLWLGSKTVLEPIPIKPSSVWAMIKTLGRQTAAWADNQQGVPEEIRKHWNRHDRQQLVNLHPHVLRHTWCTHAVNLDKVDLLAAKQHMGHSSITVTERYIWP